MSLASTGCKRIVKKKLRKLRDKVDVLAFVNEGCASCVVAKEKLAKAGVKVTYIEANCYNGGMVRKYRVKVVPTFFIVSQINDLVVTEGPMTNVEGVIRMYRNRKDERQ